MPMIEQTAITLEAELASLRMAFAEKLDPTMQFNDAIVIVLFPVKLNKSATQDKPKRYCAG